MLESLKEKKDFHMGEKEIKDKNLNAKVSRNSCPPRHCLTYYIIWYLWQRKPLQECVSKHPITGIHR